VMSSSLNQRSVGLGYVVIGMVGVGGGGGGGVVSKRWGVGGVRRAVWSMTRRRGGEGKPSERLRAASINDECVKLETWGQRALAIIINAP